jgi:hypothetical protein
MKSWKKKPKNSRGNLKLTCSGEILALKRKLLAEIVEWKEKASKIQDACLRWKCYMVIHEAEKILEIKEDGSR